MKTKYFFIVKRIFYICMYIQAGVTQPYRQTNHVEFGLDLTQQLGWAETGPSRKKNEEKLSREEYIVN